MQEAFLRYFIESSYGRDIKNPRAWLYQVLRNDLTDRINSASAKREVAAEHIDQVPSDGHDPEMSVERSQTAREFAASLSGRELECLRLRTEGLSYEEIGFAMGVRTGTVGALLARGPEKIRKRAESRGGPDLHLAAAVCYLAHR